MRNEHDRLGLTSENYLNDKKICDIIYGYYQLHSHYSDGIQYCFKSDCTYKKIEQYFGSLDKTEVPISKNTLTNINRLLIKGNFIKQTKIGGKSVYILPKTKGEYVWIKYDTLKYLVDTASPGVIKTYSYLKKWYSIKSKEGSKFWFTKRSLLQVLGYCDHPANYKLIDHILICLMNNDLIVLHEQYRQVDGIVIPNLILDKVNENFCRSNSVTAHKESVKIYL